MIIVPGKQQQNRKMFQLNEVIEENNLMGQYKAVKQVKF